MSVPKIRKTSCNRLALFAGFTGGEIFRLAKIDRWLLTQIQDTVRA